MSNLRGEPADRPLENPGHHASDAGVTVPADTFRGDGEPTDPQPELPRTLRSLAIRTDYSDQALWDGFRAALTALDDDLEPGSYLHVLDDHAFRTLSAVEIEAFARGNEDHPYLMLFDREAMTSPEHLVLVLDLSEEPGSTFRVPASDLATVEANLFLANMDFSDFVEAADENNIYRAP
ncbi:DUF6924 domain-containing protein [Streptomyces sp. NPDC002870]|uniref:DUF6924 domain-containing protein n=1 Tax=Streptomyces sp. NPDC002870 TaxID=3364666 RepID=UPI00367B98F8